MFENHKFLLRNVRYVFKFRQNLLSISMFNDIGYCNIVEYEESKFFNDA